MKEGNMITYVGAGVNVLLSGLKVCQSFRLDS